MTRANISMDKRIYDSYSTQVSRKGKTLYTSTNEWLETASEVLAGGADADDILRLWRSYAVLKEVDVITLPSDFVDDLIGMLYKADKNGILKMFGNLGSSLVGLLKIAAPDIEQLADLAKDFVMLIPVKRLEMIKTDSNSIEMNIVGAGKRLSSTECSFEFVKAILNGYGYAVTSHDVSVGAIRLRANKRSA